MAGQWQWQPLQKPAGPEGGGWPGWPRQKSTLLRERLFKSFQPLQSTCGFISILFQLKAVWAWTGLRWNASRQGFYFEDGPLQDAPSKDGEKATFCAAIWVPNSSLGHRLCMQWEPLPCAHTQIRQQRDGGLCQPIRQILHCQMRWLSKHPNDPLRVSQSGLHTAAADERPVLIRSCPNGSV